MAYLILNGGLGNQLFQLAAALDYFPSQKIHIISDLGNPRLNSSGLPDIFGFENSMNLEIVAINPKVYPKFFSKLNNFMLRTNSDERYFVGKLSGLFGLILSVATGRYLRIHYCFGVGESKRHFKASNNSICGYFQSYKYVQSETLDRIRCLKPANKSKNLSALIAKANKVKPIMIHLRLGDYLLSSDFGIPGPMYYANALNRCFEANPNKPVWLFTNDIEGARRYFPEDLLAKIDFIPDALASPAEDLELLRYGSAYVIGNSTFSWWGAYLRYDENALVVAPSPWYSGLTEPAALIPKEWLKIDSRFQKNIF